MGFQADRDIWSLLPRNSICKIHKSPPSTHPSTKIIHSGVWLYLDLLYSIRGFTSSTSPSKPESRQKGKKDTSQQSKRSVWAKCQIAQILSTQMIRNPNFLLRFYFQMLDFFKSFLTLLPISQVVENPVISILWLLFPIASRSTSEGSQFRKIFPVKLSQRGGKWKGLNYLNVSYTQRLSRLNNFDVVSTQYFN